MLENLEFLELRYYPQAIVSVSTASGNGVVSGKLEQKNVDTRRRAVG